MPFPDRLGRDKTGGLETIPTHLGILILLWREVIFQISYAPEMTKPVVSFYWYQSMTTSTTTLTMVSSIVLMEQLSSPRYDYPKCWKVMHNSPTSPNHYNKGNE